MVCSLKFPPLVAIPPPLTPPHKGKGDKVSLNLPPSPLRGGIEGGGLSINMDTGLGKKSISCTF